MKRQKQTLLAATACLFMAIPAFGQTTVVNATIIDPNNLPYAGGTMVAVLTLPPGASSAQLGSSQVTGATQRVTLDSTGSFLMNLYDNNVVRTCTPAGVCTPGGTQWAFSVNISPGVPPPLGTGPQSCPTATLTITGASQTISSSFACPALSLGGTGTGFKSVSTISAANYTALATDSGKLLRFTGCLCNVNLPNPAPPGWSVTILNASGTTIPLLINPPGALTLNGSTNTTQIMGGGATTVFSDGSNYFAPLQVLMSSTNANPCFFTNGTFNLFGSPSCSISNVGSNTFIAPAAGAFSGPWAFSGNPATRMKIQDQGQCTMAAGTCTAQSFASTYAAAPLCFLTWTGTGALAGTLKVASSTTTITPSSSNAADTAQVNWACLGN